jgi:hypothetical protein
VGTESPTFAPALEAAAPELLALIGDHVPGGDPLNRMARSSSAS